MYSYIGAIQIIRDTKGGGSQQSATWTFTFWFVAFRKKIMFNTMIRIEMALSLALSFEFISQSKEISTVTYYCKLVEDGNACDSV